MSLPPGNIQGQGVGPSGRRQRSQRSVAGMEAYSQQPSMAEPYYGRDIPNSRYSQHVGFRNQLSILILLHPSL